MTTILNQIKEYKLEEIEEAKKHYSISDLEEIVQKQSKVRPFKKRLQEKYNFNKVGLIAEIKKASPSKGIIRHDFDVEKIARSYENGGATCLSVLTDKPSFQGDNHYIYQAKIACQLPVLRKDFMFDPYQILESRALGADCVLLIMACLDNQQAIDLEQLALILGMDVLVETHNEEEIERCLTYLKSDLIGINNRNLHSFVTDISLSTQLSNLIPVNKLVVSESGIHSNDDIRFLQEFGINTFLVGESLMRQDNIELATKSLIA